MDILDLYKDMIREIPQTFCEEVYESFSVYINFKQAYRQLENLKKTKSPIITLGTQDLVPRGEYEIELLGMQSDLEKLSKDRQRLANIARFMKKKKDGSLHVGRIALISIYPKTAIWDKGNRCWSCFVLKAKSIDDYRVQICFSRDIIRR